MGILMAGISPTMHIRGAHRGFTLPLHIKPLSGQIGFDGTVIGAFKVLVSLRVLRGGSR